MKERRRFPRSRARLKVKWKKTSGALEGGLSLLDEAKNIGAGGICLMACGKDIKVDERLHLEIELPGIKTMTAQARVVWVDKLEDVDKDGRQKHEVGLEFLYLNSAEKAHINVLVAGARYATQR
jgi:hypothetical protein